MSNVNDFLMGGGPPAVKFPVPGSMVRGKVLDLALSQQRDPKSQELKTWKNGDPMMQAVITLQTDERDPNIANDDGRRRLFVASKNQKDAVRDAIITAGAKELAIGGELAMAYTGDGTPEGGLTPPKMYRAEYAPPAISTAMLGGEQSAAPQAQPAAQPAATAPAAGTSLLG